jgi:hypothetical protein
MESALANQDARRHRQMVRVANSMTATFSKALPNLGPGILDDLVADLSSLWNLRQKLDNDLKDLFEMRFPKDREHLHSFLIDIEVRQLDEASYLIRRLRKRIPTVLKALDRQERGQHRRPRANSPKNAPKLAVART